ncbi:MAG: DUF45 domain-containing protein [Syntrophales bacterium]|nr:DUF45 domain-containing protein [Syntrophales bacterium]
MIATCRNEAKFGTIATHSEKHFYRWADPYPRTVDDLPHGGSGPNDQQRLVAGMLARELGVNVAGIKIKDSRYRWGSCTVKNNVGFNWRLIKAPMFVIDYVIVHELAHLIETNHTPRFWNVVRTQAPMMDKAKVWLKENGQLLEDAI